MGRHRFARLAGERTAAGKATGSFRLTDGLAQNLELFDRVAIFTGAPQFRRMPLQEVSGNFEWSNEAVRITNLVAESKGLMRLEGNCTITAGNRQRNTSGRSNTPDSAVAARFARARLHCRPRRLCLDQRQNQRLAERPAGRSLLAPCRRYGRRSYPSRHAGH